MFFHQLLDRFSFFNVNTKPKNRKKIHVPLLSASKDESERLVLEDASKLITEEKFKQALSLVNRTIEDGITTKQLLAKKAFLLSQTKQFDEAHAIWNELSKANKPKLAELARQSLEASKKIQLEFIKKTKVLTDGIHAKANQFQLNPIYLPRSQDLLPKHNIIKLVRKQAEVARNADLPGLSVNFIDQTLTAGFESAWLIYDKAISLSLMGQQAKAIKLLGDLNSTIKNPKLKALIIKSIEEIKNNPTFGQSKLNYLLVKQAKLAAKSNSSKTKYLPELKLVDADLNVKKLIFQESRGALVEGNPKASLDIISTILDYDSVNLAALQLKGEALYALSDHNEAINVWGPLIDSGNEEISQTASMLVRKTLVEQAVVICNTKTPKIAIQFLIKQFFAYHIPPNLDPSIQQILVHVDHTEPGFIDPDLRQHQLQLLFNTEVIECLESQLRKQARFGVNSADQ